MFTRVLGQKGIFLLSFNQWQGHPRAVLILSWRLGKYAAVAEPGP